MLEISEACAEEDSDALEHEQVPKPKGDMLIDVKSEEADEPLEGQKRWVETKCFEVLRQFLEVLSHPSFEHFLVD